MPTLILFLSAFHVACSPAYLDTLRHPASTAQIDRCLSAAADDLQVHAVALAVNMRIMAARLEYRHQHRWRRRVSLGLWK